MRSFLNAVDLMVNGVARAAVDSARSVLKRHTEDFLDRHELIELSLTALRIEIGRVRKLF